MRFWAVLIIAAIPESLFAQGTGEVDLSASIVAVSYERSTRDMRWEDGSEGSATWDSGRIGIGVGIGDRIRGSIGGWYGPVEDEDVGVPESDFHLLMFGGKLAAYPYTRRNVRLGILAAYRHYTWQDRSIYREDRNIDTYRLQLRVERSFPEAMVWVAPTFRMDRLLNFRGGRLAHEADSIDNLGVAAGGSILLANHYLPFLELAYVNGVQLDIGLGYQL